jgi:hypothetical protein
MRKNKDIRKYSKMSNTTKNSIRLPLRFRKVSKRRNKSNNKENLYKNRKSNQKANKKTKISRILIMIKNTKKRHPVYKRSSKKKSRKRIKVLLAKKIKRLLCRKWKMIELIKRNLVLDSKLIF